MKYQAPGSPADGSRLQLRLGRIGGAVQNVPLARVTYRSLKFCFRIALVIGILLIAGFGALFARLTQGPISMSFLVPPVERAVNRTLSGPQFDIGDAVLRRSDDGYGIEFRLANVRLQDEENDTIAEAPLASADVSLRALLTGRLAAGEVELIGPRLYLQYSEDKGIALSFADPASSKSDLEISPRNAADNGPKTSRPTPVEDTATAQQPVQGATPQEIVRNARGRAINLSKALNHLFAATRSGESAYLTSFGIRDAVVLFDRGSQVTQWNVPSVKVNVEHSDSGSALSGAFAVDSSNGQWQVQFQADQNRQSGDLALHLALNDLVPRALSSEFPSLPLLQYWDLPISLYANLNLANNGDITDVELQAKMDRGAIYAPWEKVHPAEIDSGNFKLAYSREHGRVDIVSSDIRWGNSYVKMTGLAQRQSDTGNWAFRLGSNEIALGAEQFGLPVIPFDNLLVQGEYAPEAGALNLDRIFLQAADAQISLAGSILRGDLSPAIKLDGQFSRMPVAFFKLIWPKLIIRGARDWIGEHVPSGRINGGSVTIDIPPDLLAQKNQGAKLSPEEVSLQLDLEDLEIRYFSTLPPLRTAKAKATIAGERFFFVVPQSEIALPSGEKIEVTDGEFIVGQIGTPIPQAEIHFKSQSNVNAALELLDHPPLGYVSALNMPLPKVDATASSAFSFALPLLKDVKYKDLRITGRVNLADVQATGLPGDLTIAGGALNFDVSEKAIAAKGDVNLNNMPASITWQRIFGAPSEEQPPLNLRIVSNDASRKKLGLDIEHILQGPVATELAVTMQKEGPPLLQVTSNLTDANLLLGSLAWRKPRGQQAQLSLNVIPAEDGGAILENFKLEGKDISVKGGVSLNAKYSPVAFSFPTLALDKQTQLAVSGKLDKKNVWTVRATGTNFDGRDFFRSLFSAGKITENQPQLPKDSPGLDLHIELDNVGGYFDTTLQQVTIDARRRNNKLSFLELRGRLNGQSPLAARIKSENNNGPRELLADATDAGAAFRLVGFYPSAQGGEVSLKVNLDGVGQAETVGILFVRDFLVTGDQVVGEVLSAQEGQASGNQRRNQQQQYNTIQFDRMRVPFSVGGGKFILHDSAINGPLLGATMRGSIDFRSQNVFVSGTYVPLFGINAALSNIPLLGEVFTGRSGEGVFGITFKIEGPMSEPNVVVNPLAVVAPGFLRQLFEFNQVDAGAAPRQRRPGDNRDLRPSN